MRISNQIVEFTIHYNRHKKKLYNFALKMVSDRMICDDIIQDVFLKLFKNLDRIRNKQSILYWLFKTTRNEIYNYYRSKSINVDRFNVSNTDEIEIDSNENLENEYELKEMKDLLLAELDKLPFEQKEVYFLREYGGLSYSEIAVVLSIDENLVKSRLYKTRQKLINRFSKIL